MKRWCALYGVLLVAVLAGICWWLQDDDDPQVMAVQRLQSQLFGEDRDQLTQQQRGELREQLRDQMEQLTEDQRTALRAASRGRFREQFRARIRDFHRMSSEERIAFLDKQIDEMERRRRDMENRRERPPVRRSSAEAGGAPQGRPEFGRGRGNRGPRSEESRERWRRQRLDNSTPQERAEMAAFIEAMRQRREERGLSR